MRTITACLCVQLLALSAFAEHVLREYSWAKQKATGGAPKGAEVITNAPGRIYDLLKAQNPSDEPLTVAVLTIERPPITWAKYAILGMVRCDGVKGKAYLELWSHFPGGACFSRTQGERGPMGALTGTQEWRPFVLPFYNKEGAPPPEKLVVNVVLPEQGTVFLGPLRLAQYPQGEDPVTFTAKGTAWWGERASGLVGGLLGAAVGCLGGLIGLLSSKGKARRFVLGAMQVLMALGVMMLILGLAALILAQPYAIWYPPLLLGVLCTALPAAMLPRIRKRYEELELRKMQAADARA